MAVIFAFSNQANSGELTEHVLGDMNVPIRKCAHMFEYAVLFWLTRWSAITIRRPAYIVPGMLAFVIACSTLQAMSGTSPSFLQKARKCKMLQSTWPLVDGSVFSALFLCAQIFLFENTKLTSLLVAT